MISVSLISLLAYFLCVPLTAIMILWLYDDEKRYSKKAVPTQKTMCECDICLFHFTADKEEVFVRCPQCGNLMERKGAKH
ncbi:hypothetical protein J6T93_05745 [bacterium]|nr:hypothetical protein [bacterium]